MQLPYSSRSHYVVGEPEYGFLGGGYQVMNPAMLNVLQTPTQMQSLANPVQSSSRQHQISTAMMMKKRQMLGKGGVNKPSTGDKHVNVSGSLDDVISSKATRVIPKREDVDSVQTNTEGTMQTPPASSCNNKS